MVSCMTVQLFSHSSRNPQLGFPRDNHRCIASQCKHTPPSSPLVPDRADRPACKPSISLLALKSLFPLLDTTASRTPSILPHERRLAKLSADPGAPAASCSFYSPGQPWGRCGQLRPGQVIWPGEHREAPCQPLLPLDHEPGPH